MVLSPLEDLETQAKIVLFPRSFRKKIGQIVVWRSALENPGSPTNSYVMKRIVGWGGGGRNMKSGALSL